MKFRSTALFYLAAAAASLCMHALAVKHEDFKTCEQAAFCRRQRAFAELALKQPSSASSYSVLDSTVKLDGHRLVAQVQSREAKVPLQLEVTFMESGTVRVRVQEVDPLRPRYDDTQKHVLRDQGQKLPYAKAESLAMTSATVDGRVQHTVKYVDGGFSVRLTEKPWALEYLQQGKAAIQLNTKGFFNFEHQREKTDVDDVDGGWEETFKSWTDSKPRGPESFGLDINFSGFEHVYGIPEHASPTSLKTTKGGSDAYTDPYRMWNLDVFEYEHDSPMALYGAIPFMVAHSTEATVGVFWLNAAETWIDVTREKASTLSSFFGGAKEPEVGTHWVSESGVMDVFLLPGPTTADMYRQYAELVEQTPLPREFALGYHQCRWNYLDQKDVLDVSKRLEDTGFPYDVIWLDIEHTDGKRYFTWDSAKFPDPVAMQEQLAAGGHRLVNVVDPHIKHDSEYRVWKEANENGYFVKNKAGSDNYQGWCWPGDSNWVDYFNPNASKWVSEQFHLDKYAGSTKNMFVWNDMNEPSVFNGPEISMEKDIKHYGGWEHRDVHNIFGMMYHKATAEGLRTRESPEMRPFVLSRAYFAGSQRYGAIWTGDNAANWEHLRASVPMILSNNIAGMHFSGADVGGFFGNPDAELLTRWYQLGIWYPFFRAHAHIDTKRREPYLLGEPYTRIIRDAVRERYRLLPYWYSLFREASQTGMPIVRPMWMEFPSESSLFADDSAFMVGSALMVVPITNPDMQTVDVRFPTQQTWYSWETHAIFSGPLKRQFLPTLETTLVFVKGGSIIPTRDRHRASSALMKRDPFTLYVFPNRLGKATGRLYVDDGDSFDYTKGAFVERELSFANATLTSRSLQESVEELPERSAFLEQIKKVRVERVVIMGLRNPIAWATVREGDEERKIAVHYGGAKKDSELIIRDPAVLITNDWSIELSQ